MSLLSSNPRLALSALRRAQDRSASPRLARRVRRVAGSALWLAFAGKASALGFARADTMGFLDKLGMTGRAGIPIRDARYRTGRMR
jgi:hypothetical protein